MSVSFSHKPVVLAVLDGWGLGRPYHGNAIFMANTPHMDEWWEDYPHASLVSHGQKVGLLSATTGNSEVGHINLGAGYIVPQDEVRINKAIEDGLFMANPALVEACQQIKRHGSTLHILGLVGPGEVHSRIDHLWAMLDMAKQQQVSNVYVHLISDGRDAPPTWMGKNAAAVEEKVQSYGATVASLCGRYFAMDRNNQWERTAKAYNLLTQRKGGRAATLEGAVQANYDRGLTDEFIEPMVLGNGRAIKDGDSVVFINFRTDRPRQLTRAFVDKDFKGFRREFEPRVYFYTMTEYEAGLAVAGVAFAPVYVAQPLAQVVSAAGLKQLHISETEKYAHVTFFINGGREEPFKGEDRQLIASPHVATYDKQPAMSAKELTEAVAKAVKDGQYDLIIMNYPNADMVGHSGNLEATIEAVEAVDHYLGQLAEVVIAAGGALVITADHGNAETMLTPDNHIDTQHHSHEVPLIVVGNHLPGRLKDGVLANVAPTVLQLLGLTPPADMTADSLWQGGKK